MTARASVLLSLLLAAVPALLPAQHVPPLLALPGGARAMGLGGAFVAGDGPEVLFYNPAQISLGRGTALSMQHAESGMLGSLATGTALLGVSVGAGVQFLESDRRRGPGGDGASSLEAVLGASVERKGIRVGLGARYVQEHRADGRAAVPALDLGAATNVRGVTVALAVTNGVGLDFGRATRRIRLPTRVTLGGMLSNETLSTWFDIGGSASVSVEEGGRFVPAGGVEVSYFPVSGWSLVARGGLHGRSRQIPGQEAIWNLGATLGADRLAVDYAFAPPSGPIGAEHRVSLRIRP